MGSGGQEGLEVAFREAYKDLDVVQVKKHIYEHIYAKVIHFNQVYVSGRPEEENRRVLTCQVEQVSEEGMSEVLSFWSSPSA